MAVIPVRRILCLCLAASIFGRPASAAELRPSWECLPDDTVAMVRLPRPAAFLETLRARTKFGAVILDAGRMQKAWDLARATWGGDGGEPDDEADLDARLARYGLGIEDLEAAFAGDMGVGVVMRQREGLPPLVMALAWAEPGTEPAERMVAAFHHMLEETAGDEAAPQRIDVEMAGHPVTWVTSPILRVNLGDVKVDGGLDPDTLRELRKELDERARQAPEVTVGKVHLFLTRVGGRLIAGQTMPPTVDRGLVPREDGVRRLESNAGAAPVAGDIDPDRLSGTDEARGIFERFLATHGTGDGSPLADVLLAPGMRATLPPGETLVDVVFDPRPLLRAGDPQAVKLIAAAGFGELGPMALRQSFDGGRLRQGLFVTLPAPRNGLCRILDQDCDAAEVPSLVTSEVVDFTQISLDLAQAYRTIKEVVAEVGGAFDGSFGEDFRTRTTNGFSTLEGAAQALFGIGLEAMLANLGSRHWILTYPSQVAAAVQEARRNREAARGALAPDANRVAFVWKLGDDAPVVAILPKIAALAQAQVVEEQGFQGARLPGGMSVFAGQGHLVVAFGGDVLEKTLAGIRNPPAGNASLREGDVPAKGAELVGLGPCRMFALGDARQTGGMLGELREFMTAMVPDDVEDRYRDILAKAQALFPPAEEMQGMFGVGATNMEVTEAGIEVRSAWEMPAP